MQQKTRLRLLLAGFFLIFPALLDSDLFGLFLLDLGEANS